MLILCGYFSIKELLTLVFYGKGKGIPNRPESYGRGGRGISLLFFDLGARMGWVVSTTPQPLYPRERPDTHCTGGWEGPRAGLDVCEKSHPHRDSIPGPSSYTD